ncbi:circularly permuted type 2 ATP-grasp protein [uncultured Desulfosarcina sp.]|uniref:circularly permuted type 2 ATP-grasp protein n=1 Tax=uncultured Desulfosarcina sp. TaxID=218289 RepID=UPI0029C8EC1B|nr:circularly permuted type 2 ATP-grasp protein [uncultured Desulfosarcina sp.]
MAEPIAAGPASRFESIPFPEDSYSEAFGSPGIVRDHWRALMEAFSSIPTGTLDQRQERVRRMRHEDGATFNPFDDAGGRGTPWALEMIPLPITADEWSMLEAGLTQRALLLERILADVYGPQDLIRQGHLPAELVFANPNFLRSCHGIAPAGNRPLTYYAVDLYRGADGRFRVFRDYADTPAGIGYALENRIVISRAFSSLYHQNQIRRLASFFHTLHQSLIDRSPLRRDDPGIVLLSPGPDSRIYFEHALLSRYLGYPLVEAQDLTVRKEEVFLKKLAGLEPVQTILRHVADAHIDPFVGSRSAAGGVAGLIQAFRQQQIDIVNPIGSGFVDTPALAAFLPDLCRQLMGTELLLENHPSWYCGTEAGRSHVLANLSRLIVEPAMQRFAPVVPKDDPAAGIAATPHLYMAREPIQPSTVPAWIPGKAASRYTLMRFFACAGENGFTFMPGGLAITAGYVETLVGNELERQQSKDIWIFSDRPVVPFSLMSSLQTVSTFKRGSDLPSRVADHLLWLGRYLERSENMIRLLRSVFRRLAGEARTVDIPELPFLLNLLRSKDSIPNVPEGQEDSLRYRELSVQLKDALFRQDRSGSVAANLKRVQQAAKSVRDRLSLDCWRVINHLDGFAEAPGMDPLELLDETLFTLSAFSGLAMESMTRGLGWRFMDMGRRVERAINQVHLVNIALPLVCNDSRSALEALLEVSDSIMTYRARYRTAFQLAPVLDLLVMDESNPKSLAFQCSQIAEHVGALPRQGDLRYATAEERLALEMLTAVRLLDLSGIDCKTGNDRHAALRAFFEVMDHRLTDFAQQVNAPFLDDAR